MSLLQKLPRPLSKYVLLKVMSADHISFESKVYLRGVFYDLRGLASQSNSTRLLKMLNINSPSCDAALSKTANTTEPALDII